jgi:hypothetical protein
MVQAHRLGFIDVGHDLVARYGPFGTRLRFADLEAELSRLGYALTETASDGEPADVRRYWLAESRVCIAVTTDRSQGRLDAGDVWSISALQSEEAMAAAGVVGAEQRAIKDGLQHLLRLGDTDRVRWLDRHTAAGTGGASMWLGWFLVVDWQLRDRPTQRPGWLGLRLWLLEQAQARGVFDAADSAEKMAYFALAMRRAGVDSNALPSADALVRACLDAIGAEPGEVAVLDDLRDLRGLDLAAMRLSGQAKSLVNAAEFHLDDVRDERLAARLREWIVLKPRLV